MSNFIKLIRDTKGATAIEYGLIAALIAVAAIGAMQSIGSKLSDDLQQRVGRALDRAKSAVSGPRRHPTPGPFS